MDAAKQRWPQMIARIQPFPARIWYILRSLKTTGVLLFVMGLVLVVGLLLPQQTATTTNPPAQTAWLNNLPGWGQPAGGILFSMGFAQIFHTPWFWFPVALLLLNSLIHSLVIRLTLI